MIILHYYDVVFAFVSFTVRSARWVLNVVDIVEESTHRHIAVSHVLLKWNLKNELGKFLEEFGVVS